LANYTIQSFELYPGHFSKGFVFYNVWIYPFIWFCVGICHKLNLFMKKNFLIIIFAFSITSSFGQNNQPMETKASKPFILGAIDEIYSKELSEYRVLNIYLPEGYNKMDTVKYPVIYLLDGSANEDFIHIVGLVQFFSFEWINLVPKSIVVGIATVDRKEILPFQPPLKTIKELTLPLVILSNLYPLLKRNYSHILRKAIRQAMKKQSLDNLWEGCLLQKFY